MTYQDIEIIFNLFGKIPDNIVDTQLCLPEIGFSHSIGYAEACKNLLNVEINKKTNLLTGEKTTRKRKIHYAIKDVKYLPKLFLKINEKINIKKNINILASHKKLLNEETYKKKPEKAWEKLKISETKKYEISRLKKICFFREKLAKKKNIPVKRIISDQKIKILCKKEIKQKEKN